MEKMKNIEETIEKGFNVAGKSSNGHFITKANVVTLKKDMQMFVTEGASELVTKNHTTIKTKGRTFIAPQQVVDPVMKVRRISED